MNTSYRDSPYQGLGPFDVEDGPFFFGRTRDRKIIESNLISRRFTIFYGESGVGKSSVLQAGVARDLQLISRRNLETFGTPEILPVVFRDWHDAPETELPAAIVAAVQEILGDATPQELAAPSTLIGTLEAWTRTKLGDLLLILDQFEEYFLYHGRNTGPDSFFSEFSAAVTRQDLAVNSLVSLRADSISLMDRFKGKIPGLMDNYLRIRQLTREGAIEAIVKPVETFNESLPAGEKPYELEDGFPEYLLDEALRPKKQEDRPDEAKRLPPGEESEQIETPYLQLILSRLWHEDKTRQLRTLRRDTLKDLGGAADIVREHLESNLAKLTEDEQETLASVFAHLVTRSGTKIALSLEDLVDLTHADRDHLDRVLEKLSQSGARVLRPLPEKRFEIFHDVLAGAVREWSQGRLQEKKSREKFAKLQREEKAKLAAIQQRRLRIAVTILAVLFISAVLGGWAIWDLRNEAASDRDGARQALADAKREANRELEDAKQKATQKLAEAQDAADRKVAEAEEAANDKVAAAQEEARQKLEVAQLQAAEADAETEEVRAEASRLRREVESYGPYKTVLLVAEAEDSLAEPERALKLALAAELGLAALPTRHPEVQVRTNRVLRKAAEKFQYDRVLRGHDGGIYDIAVSSDGHLAVTASLDTTARIWDLRDGTVRRTLAHPTRVVSAKFLPGQHVVATAGEDGWIRFWSASAEAERANEPMHEFEAHQGVIFSLTIDEEGRRLAAASGDGTVSIWKPKTDETTIDGREKLELERRLEDPQADGADVDSDLGETETMFLDLAFDSNGKYLAAATDTGEAHVWDANTGGLARTIPSWSRQECEGVAFIPDGRLVVAELGGSAQVVDLESGAIVHSLRQSDRMHRVAITSDGKWIATGGDRNIVIWNAETGQRTLRLEAHADSVFRLAFLPSGRLASASMDKTAKIWDIPHLIRAAARYEGVLAVERWPDSSGGLLLTENSPRTTPTEEPFDDEEFDPWQLPSQTPLDGNIKRPWSKGGSLFVSNAVTGDQMNEIARVAWLSRRHAQIGRSVAEGSEPTAVVALGQDRRNGTITVFDSQTMENLWTVPGPVGDLAGLAFGSDSMTLALWRRDRSLAALHVYRYSSKAEKAPSPTVLPVDVDDWGFPEIAVSVDGSRVAVATEDDWEEEIELKIWDTRSGDRIFRSPPMPAEDAKIAFRPDGKQLAMGVLFGSRIQLYTWSEEESSSTGSEGSRWREALSQPYIGDMYIERIGMSPAGSRAAYVLKSPNGSLQLVQECDLVSGRVSPLPVSTYATYAFTDDENVVTATLSNGRIKVEGAGLDVSFEDASSSRIVLSPRGGFLCSVSSEGGTEGSPRNGEPGKQEPSRVSVRLWSLADSTELTPLTAEGIVEQISFSPDESRFFLLTTKSGLVRDLTSEEGSAVSFADPRSRRLQQWMFDYPGDRLVEVTRALQYRERIDTVEIRTGTEGRTVFQSPGVDIDHFSLSRDGKQLALSYSDQRIELRDSSNPEGDPLEAPPMDLSRGKTAALALSPSANVLAVAQVKGAQALLDEDRTTSLCLWSTGTGQAWSPSIELTGADPDSIAIRFDRSGRRVAVLAGDRAWLLDVRELREATEPRSIEASLSAAGSQFTEIAFDGPLERVATATVDGTVRVWDVALLEEVPELISTLKQSDPDPTGWGPPVNDRLHLWFDDTANELVTFDGRLIVYPLSRDSLLQEALAKSGLSEEDLKMEGEEALKAKMQGETEGRDD